MRVLLLGALLILPTAAQAADEPLRLEPRTEWVLDYADERCSLHGGFGEEGQALNLRIDWFGPRMSNRILVVGEPIPKFGNPTSELRYRFTPDAEYREGSTLNGTFRELPAVSFSSWFLTHDPVFDGPSKSAAQAMKLAATPRPPEPEFERQVRSLEMRFANGTAIVLALGPMARPLEMVRACLDNLQESWGLDPARQRTLTRLAVPKASTVRRVQRRYPPRMVLTGTNAFVPVRVMVDAAGAVTACVVQSEGIDDDFTDAVCDGLARGYEPALDAQGNPVASVFNTSVIYLLN